MNLLKLDLVELTDEIVAYLLGFFFTKNTWLPLDPFTLTDYSDCALILGPVYTEAYFLGA